MVSITLFRWTRAPNKPFSDQRNCRTAGPSLRLTIARLPRCIVIHLRHGLAQENLQASAAKQGYVEAVGVNCFAAAAAFDTDSAEGGDERPSRVEP